MGTELSKLRDPTVPALSRLIRRATLSKAASPSIPPQISSEETSLPISPQNKFIEGRQYQDSPNAYHLPNDSTEWDRERLQHKVMKEAFGGNCLAPVQDKLAKYGNVLELGCGPGTWLLDIAAEFPNATCVGVDITDTGFSSNVPPNCTFQLANVTHPLPFKDESFDLVQFRNFVGAMEATLWPTVLREIRRVLKPGGCVQIVGGCMDGYGLKGPSKEFVDSHRVIYKARGIDLSIALKFTELIKDAGLEPIENRRVSIPFGHGGILGEMLGFCIIEAMNGAMPVLTNLLETDLEEFVEKIDQLKIDIVKYQAHVDWRFAVGRK